MRYYSHTYLPTRTLLNSFFHSDKKSYSCYNINNINRMKLMAYKDLYKQKNIYSKCYKKNETSKTQWNEWKKKKEKNGFIWN